MEHHHCQDLIASLSDYIDGDLSPELCAELDKHMLDCQNCRIVVDTLRKTVYLYQAVSKSEELPSVVRERLFKRLELEEFLKPDV
jgi:anti-sigma factor RsiW